MSTPKNAAPLRVRISAPNSPNPFGRWRGKPARCWTKTPIEVEVVDDPKGDGQISHASFERIKADSFLKVEFVGGMGVEELAAGEISELKATIAKQAERIARLEHDLGEEADKLAEERRLYSRRLRSTNDRASASTA
jgi:hypothetical protein